VTADYQVMWTKVAESDLLAILEYIMQNSAAAGKEAFNKIKIKAENLALFPERERVVSEFLVRVFAFTGRLLSLHCELSTE
jgi:plasmid stabilization system protein ParE